ncbi:sialidase precursor [mine drainage metagenome]|uniref:Sialidase n=1 Tax=mine drainage metagenome TaxID=410659 RepID=A0A1J5TEP0_9ZZZZ
MKKNSLNNMVLFLFCSIFFWACNKNTPPHTTSNPVLTQDSLSFSTQLFTSGDGGYNTYRIPAIIKTPEGSLLAFIEGRVNSSADFGNVKILVKKSTDNGKTWGASLMVAENGNLQAGNSSPVVDYTDPAYPKGRIFLFYCTGNNTQANVTNLNGVREVFYIASSDNGNTWSPPVNITLQVHHPYQPNYNTLYIDSLKWTAYATGPGHALQLTQGIHSGRIVVPINHGIYINKTNYAAVFYSDNHCKTFQLSPDVCLQSDETTSAELKGGGVLLNSRNQYLPGNYRILSYDSIGNLNNTTIWQTAFNHYLPEPICEGAMLNYTNISGQQILLFCNPTSIKDRSALGVRQSFDQGKTWTNPLLVDTGFSAYSDIVILPSGHLGIIYEADNYTTIKFTSFNYGLIPVN